MAWCWRSGSGCATRFGVRGVDALTLGVCDALALGVCDAFTLLAPVCPTPSARAFCARSRLCDVYTTRARTRIRRVRASFRFHRV
ncbi:hypothetical protein C8R43DRAFT_966595 [Mycena crocata]|nr:hypothetical protein C8R43DRAFT_966595 [Mycena crocata]